MDGEAVEPEPVASTDVMFDRLYPAMVELARRLLDPHRRTDASIGAACSIADDVMLRSRVHRVGDDVAGTARIAGWIVDECLDHMVGHPGQIELREDCRALLESVEGEVSVAELQAALSGMRRTDRRVGLVVLAGGFSPGEAAALLDRTPEDVTARLVRVARQLTDRRRLLPRGDVHHLVEESSL